MQRELIVNGRGLGGTSDLTLLAPIRPGFVDALEATTYKTRTKLVLDLLHSSRQNLHEYSWAELISDSVERVGAIHSVRVAVLEPEDKVLLAVTFDGSRESYIRVLWDKVGTLLDLVFCGTIDYVTAWNHSFDEWMAWGRRVQIETGFFYGPAEFTARDVLYERRISKMRERAAPTVLLQAELDELRAVLPTAEQMADNLMTPSANPPADEPPVLEMPGSRMSYELTRMGIQGLAALYSLVGLHRPGTPDGDVLWRAAVDLLREFVRLQNCGKIDQELDELKRSRFSRQLDWLFPVPPGVNVCNQRLRPDAPGKRPDPVPNADVQGGILRGYEGVTHGVLVFLAFPDAAAAGDALGWLLPRMTKDTDSHVATPGRVFYNASATFAGVRATGIDEDTLQLFPEEFRQGMSARAGLIGDIANNHPSRWRQPRRFVSLDAEASPEAVELDAVHLVVQLRCGDLGAADAYKLTDAAHPLRAAVAELIAAVRPHAVLAIQDMVSRYGSTWGSRYSIDAFGYAEGIGQPDINHHVPPFELNRVLVGEVVLGYDNSSDFAIDAADPSLPACVRERERWLKNGSFLVVRKYAQFVQWLDETVRATAAEMAKEFGGTSNYVEVVYSKLMGRWRSGQPVVAPNATDPNFFDYLSDGAGSLCPLHAHIRRANFRDDPAASARFPRLVRRGMSFGPLPGAARPGEDTGLIFLAYNASLGEQYEVVQRWLVGGNSTGSTSDKSCPIVGVAQGGLSRRFAFEYSEGAKTREFSVKLDGDSAVFNEPISPTRLDWGMYLFAPSLSTLGRLQSAAAAAAGVSPAPPSVPWSVARGRAAIASLLEVEAREGKRAAADAWKAALEDSDAIDRLESAAIWAAIREDDGGILKTPYGVIVADGALLRQVLLDADERYSVCGQQDRMRQSFGAIYLGLDAGEDYRQQSAPINGAIATLSEADGFDLAYHTATVKIDAIVEEAIRRARNASDPAFEVLFEALEVLDDVLATLSEAWLGIGDDAHRRFRRGPTNWLWKRGQPPFYPGHFTAISRYMFQPDPGPTVVELGRSYGQALREAMRLFVGDHRAAGTIPTWHGHYAPVATAAFNHPLGKADDDFVARIMVGILMAFTPTIIGAALNVLTEWSRDGVFGAVRARVRRCADTASAKNVVRDAMAECLRARPLPQITWRTVKKPHGLGRHGEGKVQLHVGDKIVLSLVSGTQEGLAAGHSDGLLMFGGDRTSAPHPTHACPGRAPGNGALLGTLTALLRHPIDIRPGPTAQSFLVRGTSLQPVPIIVRPIQPPFIKPRRFRTGAPRIIAYGDSWVNNPYVLPCHNSDLLVELTNRGIQCVSKYANWQTYGLLEQMADPQNLSGFCNFLIAPSNADATAILLSGGGNDSVKQYLPDLINPNGNPNIIDPGKLAIHLQKLGNWYGTIIQDIRAAGITIPIIVHGYDHPIPLGRSSCSWETGRDVKTWMVDPFAKKGYDAAGMRAGMKLLIDGLNDSMLAKLNDVRYVDLRDTISTAWPGHETDHWYDDLHPRQEAFQLMAAKIAGTVHWAKRHQAQQLARA